MRVSLSLSACRLTLAMCSVLAVGLLVGVAPGLAVNLPDGRVYEEVTPVHMNGASIQPMFLSSDGESMFFLATNPFTGRSGGDTIAPFEAQRTPAGWKSYELLPPASEYFPPVLLDPIFDFSANLTKSLLLLTKPFESGIEVGSQDPGELYIQESDGSSGGATPTREVSLTPAAQEFEATRGDVIGDSADFSHGYYMDGFGGALWEEVAQGTPSQHNQEVAVEGTVNSQGVGTPLGECGAELGNRSVQGSTRFHAIAPNGSTVFFSEKACLFSTKGPSSSEVLARINDLETIPISEPTLGNCPGAGPSFENVGKVNFQCKNSEFQGASTDGSKVFFTSTQAEEVPGVTDSTENLYEAEVGGVSSKSVTSRIQISAGDLSGEGARVQGVVRISDDGSHVYFVAQGDLTATSGPEGKTAQNGADNLYVYDEGTTKFIGELCSGLHVSGSVADSLCPGSSDQSLWQGNDERPAWAAPFGSANDNGRYLVFDAYTQLISTGPEADTDTARDVYEFDSQTGTLVRVSIGRDGFDNNGNDNTFDATIPAPNYSEFGAHAAADNETYVGNAGQGRPVSNDGKFVFFQTSEALEADDVNNAPDVYEWHEGLVSLISDGVATGKETEEVGRTANVFVGSSADGRDVIFSTPDPLLPENGGNPAILYDARIGGGIPQAIVPPPCREDACQGTISPSPSFPSPSSALYDSGGNRTLQSVKQTAQPKKTTKKKIKTKKRSRKAKKRKAKSRKSRAANGKVGK